jgi:hypothetical protein
VPLVLAVLLAVVAGVGLVVTGLAVWYVVGVSGPVTALVVPVAFVIVYGLMTWALLRARRRSADR